MKPRLFMPYLFVVILFPVSLTAILSRSKSNSNLKDYFESHGVKMENSSRMQSPVGTPTSPKNGAGFTPIKGEDFKLLVGQPSRTATPPLQNITNAPKQSRRSPSSQLTKYSASTILLARRMNEK